MAESVVAIEGKRRAVAENPDAAMASYVRGARGWTRGFFDETRGGKAQESCVQQT